MAPGLRATHQRLRQASATGNAQGHGAAAACNDRCANGVAFERQPRCGPRHNPYLRIAFAPLNTRVIARYRSAGVPRLQAVRADDAGGMPGLDDDDSPPVTLPVTRMMAAFPELCPSRARDASQLHACRVPP